MPSKAPYSVGFKPIVAKLDKGFVDVPRLEHELEAVSKQWAEEFIAVIKVYPPPKKNGSYVRTGRLGANWRPAQRREYNKLITYVVNAVRDPLTGAYYMQRVQGISQIPMHKRTGWMNVWGAMRKFGSADFKKRVQKAMDIHIARQRKAMANAVRI
jgi:hypothetical protein